MSQEYKHLLQELHLHRPKLVWDDVPRPDLDPKLKRLADATDSNFCHPLKHDEVLQLAGADGDELEWKLRQVNSSAALLINVFHALCPRKTLIIDDIGAFTEYRLEVKLPTLMTSKAPANIDMRLENETTVLYIESKFTEPFHERFHEGMVLNPSYQKAELHVDPIIHGALAGFFHLEYRYYDAVQLLRHAVAIYRDVKVHPDTYAGKRVVLMNLAWEMKNTLNQYPSLFEIQTNALTELNDFAPKFGLAMRQAFQTLGVDFKFVYVNYEDFISRRTNIQEIDPETYDYVKERYLFQRDAEVSLDDRLKYLEHSIPNGPLQIELKELFQDMDVKEIQTVDALHASSFNEPKPSSDECVVVLSESPTPSNLFLPVHGFGNVTIMNSYNHYRKASVLVLAPKKTGTS